MENHNGWQEWSKFVLKELERLNVQQDLIRHDIHKISIEIAMLKVKSGVWGIMGGFIPVIVLIVIHYLK